MTSIRRIIREALLKEAESQLICPQCGSGDVKLRESGFCICRNCGNSGPQGEFTEWDYVNESIDEDANDLPELKMGSWHDKHPNAKGFFYNGRQWEPEL